MDYNKDLKARGWCTLAREYVPPAGFAAASTVVRAGRQAHIPALATATSCCSIAHNSACTPLTSTGDMICM